MSDSNVVNAYRQLIDGQVTEFVNASRFFGEPLTAMAYMVKRAFDVQLNFITSAVVTPRPDDVKLSSMIEPLSSCIRDIQDFRDRNRSVEEFFNHLSTISESIVALSWIGVKPAPAQFIRDMKDAGEYFGNRVLSTNKGNQRHQTWINKWSDILRGLEQYVRQYHLTGVDWDSASRAGGGEQCSMHTLPPPPPPPPSYVDVMAGGDNRHALLNDLNQGVGIVRMLKPVKQSNTTHPQTGVTSAAVAASQKPPAERTYPPKFMLEGRKWRVEHQKDNLGLVIETDDMSQSLAMFKCQNVGLEARNKMNGVTIDNCKRSTVVLSDIISSVELIRCERLKLQCSGHVPLISLDNCDSIQVFLTDKSIDAEVISSKSTSLNICLLAPDGDYTELAVPEQIKTLVVGRKLQSTVVEKM